ncbi:MAG: efflux RND transporter periplasmic adaptor subunit [Chitinophagales bacterium]
MKNNRTLYVIGGLLLLAIVIGVAGKKAGWWGKDELKQVAVEKAMRRSIVETVTASGKLYPEMEVKISSEVSGEIIQLNVKEGDSVKKGDLLLIINPVIYESVVAQSQASVSQVRANRMSAEASYKNAKALYDQAVVTFGRNKQLHDEKIISDAEFDQASNALKNAETAMATAREQLNAASFTINSGEAQLKQASDNLKKTRIYAPATGIISLLNVKLGERVVGTAQMAGTELIRIADLEHMQAQVDVNESDVLRVKVGDTAEVEVDAYLNKKFKGVVSEIAYSSTTATAIVSTSQATNFTVKVKLVKTSYAELIDAAHGQAYPFRPGMSATVDIKTQAKENVLSVPIQAVTPREKKDLEENAVAHTSSDKKEETDARKDMREIVFVVDKGKVRAVPVTIGIQDANYIEVTGVDEKMEVVKAPFKLISKSLKPGDLVEVVSEKELYKTE